MEAAAPEGAEPGSGGSGAEEPVVSLAEVLAENEELEKEARAVLGGSDHERCSYSQGAVKRQALYACSTCTPPGAEPAGICLACSYECHGTHRLFELYTKRNFRCDCGNSKFKNLQCKLLPEKGKVNSGNKYNDNFYGLYCTCKRPYPDPEDEIPAVRVIPMVASVGSFLGFLTATFLVIYPEVNEEPKEESKGLGPPGTAEGGGAGAEKPTVLKLTRKGAAAAEPEGESAV